MYKQQSPSFDVSLNHKIDMTCLFILYVGFFSCLIRSDYNFVIIFFAYFIWQQRKDPLTLRIIMVSIIVLFVFELFFLLTEIRLWRQRDQTNPVWDTIQPLHVFGIICFIVINLAKIVLLVFVCKGISASEKAVQAR